MEQKRTLIRDFTKGSIPKLLVSFMLPFMVSNAMQVLYSAVDMIIVGKYVGSAGLSAVSQGSQVFNFATMLCMGFCTGGQVYISQLIGAGKRDRLNSVIGTLFTLVFLFGVFFSAVILCIREPLMTLLNMPVESHGMAVDYITICGVGLIFTFFYNMLSSVLRGMGDSQRPFLFISIASVINLVLDILFTGIWGWGVAGAAAATIIGQAVSFLFSLIYLYRRRDLFCFDFRRASFRIDASHAKVILTQGIPIALQSGAVHVSMLYVNSLVNGLGVVASATFGIGIKIDDICNKVTIGIRNAAAPMIAQNFAARDLVRSRRVVHWAWGIAAAMHGLFIALYLTFGTELFGLFSSDPAVLKLSAVFISAIIWTFFPLAIMRGTTALTQGVGNARLNLINGLIDSVLLRIGLSYYFGVVANMGFYGFVLGYGLAPCGAAIIGLIYYFSRRWETRRTLA